jgi:hypothetical protein
MLSVFAKLLLAMSALSPVTFTWAIADYSRNGYRKEQLIALAATLILAIVSWSVLQLGSRSLTKITFNVEELKAIDNEIVAYIVTYLFPLVAPSEDISLPAQAAVLLILAVVLATSNAFTFNPILSFIGYHFYEVKCSTGVSYLLLSRSDLTDVKTIKKVGRLSKHLMLDLS